MQVDQQTLADIFDVSPRTIRNWQSEGMPVQGTRNDRKYDTSDCVTWAAGHKLSPGATEAPTDIEDLPSEEEADRRWKVARAQLRELEVAREKGELIPVEMHAERLIEVSTRMRQILRNWQGRGLDEALACESKAELIALRKDLVRRLFEELRDLGGHLSDELEEEESA